MTLPQRATDLVCAVLLLVAALAARLPGLNGDLWLDEAWVANSILAPTWWGMFFYPPWMQTTPPLYLVVTRCLVALFGDSNGVFRSLSLAFGVASVFLAVYLGRRLYSPLIGWLAGVLIALSGSAAMFSKEGKSYSGELLVALLLMTVAVELPAWWMAAAAVAIGFGFSYSSVVFFPGIILAYCWVGRWREGFGIAAAASLPVALTYVFYIQPNQGEDLREMWRYAFPQGDLPGFYLRTTQTVFAIHLWEPLRAVSWLRQLILILSLLGIARAGWQIWAVRDARLLVAGVLPFVGTIVLNASGHYPYDGERFSIYLLGCVGLLLVAGVDWALPKSVPGATIISVALTAGAVAAAVTGHWPRRVDVGLSEALQELRRQGAGAADLLFVAPLQWESLVFEQRHKKLALETMEGRVASACCPRDGRWQAENREDEVAGEMDQFIARGTGRRIWLLHMRLKMLTAEGQRVPEAWQRAYLVRKGCREEFAHQYQSTVLSAYRCPLL